MKIGIIGANGKQGRFLTKEALDRGIDVTAIIRHGDAPDARAKTLRRDLFDLTYNDVKDFDVLICAFGVFKPDELSQYEKAMKHLAEILKGKPNRLLVVGGAGVLYIDAGHKVQLMNTHDFPAQVKPLAEAMGKGLEVLKKHNDVNWTYLSPSAFFDVNGKKTGHYKAGGNELMKNSKGESTISYADYAVAMIDEAEKPKHIKEHYTVVSE